MLVALIPLQSLEIVAAYTVPKTSYRCCLIAAAVCCCSFTTNDERYHCARRVAKTRFVAVRTPLSTVYELRLDEADAWTVDMLVERQPVFSSCSLSRHNNARLSLLTARARRLPWMRVSRCDSLCHGYASHVCALRCFGDP